MVFIGLLGGASYVNVFYLILKRSTILREREEQEAVRAYLTNKGHDPSGYRDVGDIAPRKKSLRYERAQSVITTTDRELDSEDTLMRSRSDSVSAAPHAQFLEGINLTTEERNEIRAIHGNLNDVWAARREMGMSIGALYATLGVTLGTIVDLIFTNTMLKHRRSC
ncbi:hypothetical protein CUR178_03294 [Leishmania enriettii]|nr:hypothetical protein CUR178_03294 [Leishmania enriettii]